MSQSIPTSPILLPFPSLGVPHITDCVAGELEKLGTKFRVAQKCVPLLLYLHLLCLLSLESSPILVLRDSLAYIKGLTPTTA